MTDLPPNLHEALPVDLNDPAAVIKRYERARRLFIRAAASSGVIHAQWRVSHRPDPIRVTAREAVATVFPDGSVQWTGCWRDRDGRHVVNAIPSVDVEPGTWEWDCPKEVRP